MPDEIRIESAPMGLKEKVPLMANITKLTSIKDPWVDVRAFGAKGDGLDDTPAIQNAIDSLPSTGGVILLPSLGYNIKTNLIIRNNATVTGQGIAREITSNVGTRLKIANGIDGIQINDGGRLHNVLLYVNSGYTNTVLTVGGTDIVIISVQKILDNIVLRAEDKIDGTGLKITAMASSTDSAIYFCSFGTINIRSFKHPVSVYATESGGHAGFINANYFERLTLEYATHPLELEAIGTAAIDGNTFACIDVQADSSGTVDGIYLINSDHNHFSSVQAYDWESASGSAVRCDSNSDGNEFFGLIPSINDSGSNNYIQTPHYGRAPGLWSWLSSSVIKTGGTDYTVDGTWTDLDLTSVTSSQAKYVILVLEHTSSCTVGDYCAVRKNGDTPSIQPTLLAQVTGVAARQQVIVAMDTSQIIEYYTTDASDTRISILGYIE